MGPVGLLEVFQDAALELVHMPDAFLAHEDGRLLAANAPGAEAHHRLAFQLRLVGAQRGREFGELGDPPVDGALESAVVHFEGIAGVQRHHGAARVVVALRKPAPQRGGIHRGRAPFGGPDGGVVHADDLALDLHQHLAKGLGRRPALLRFQRGKARIRIPQPLHEAPHGVRLPGQEHVDAFFRQQDGALEAVFPAPRVQAVAQRSGVGQRNEQVAGDVEDVVVVHRDGGRRAGMPSAGPSGCRREQRGIDLVGQLRDGQGGGAAGHLQQQQLAPHDGIAHGGVGRDVAQVQQAHRAARIRADEAVQNLLELARDRPAVARARGLVHDQAHVLALLLRRQHLDRRIRVRQGGGLGRGHDEHFRGERDGEQHHVGDAGAGVEQEHVVARRERLDDVEELAAHLGGEPRILDHARPGEHDGKPAGRLDHGVVQFRLADEDVVQRDLGMQVQDHVQVREAEIRVEHEHAVAAPGEGCGEVGGNEGLAHASLAAGDGNDAGTGWRLGSSGRGAG